MLRPGPQLEGVGPLRGGPRIGLWVSEARTWRGRRVSAFSLLFTSLVWAEWSCRCELFCHHKPLITNAVFLSYTTDLSLRKWSHVLVLVMGSGLPQNAQSEETEQKCTLYSRHLSKPQDTSVGPEATCSFLVTSYDCTQFLLFLSPS